MGISVKSLLRVQNIMSHSPKIGNTTLWRTMPKNGQREKEEVETFSEWVKAIRSFIQIRIGKLRRSMSTNAISVFKGTKVAIFTTNML
jgi:hypothetical protein